MATAEDGYGGGEYSPLILKRNTGWRRGGGECSPYATAQTLSKKLKLRKVIFCTIDFGKQLYPPHVRNTSRTKASI